MSGTLRERGRWLLFLFPAVLARLGIVDRRKGEEAFDLAVPVMVTGAMRTLLRTADFFIALWLALSIAGFSADRTFRGGLRGAGDTRWPFYGTMVGNYLVRMPIAFAALPAGAAVAALGVSVTPGFGLGLPAVFAAIVADFYVRAAINGVRFRSGRWKAIGRVAEAG